MNPKLLFLAAVCLVAIPTRSWAQDGEEVSDEGEAKVETEKPALKKLEPSSGPSLYYDGKDFLLEVKPGFVLKVFSAENNGTKHVGSVVIDKAASSVKGSFVSAENFIMNLDWKDEEFSSRTGELKVSDVMLKMKFGKMKKEWGLTDIEVAKATVSGENIMNSKISPISVNGYVVSAPIGLAYCCGTAGAFPPAGTNSNNKYKLGLEMPGLKLQVFNVDRFGPSWYCGGTSIGLWVGLLTTLFFAMICYMGFGMLANIQTMDRFDDPKGKPIHVPNTD